MILVHDSDKGHAPWVLLCPVLLRMLHLRSLPPPQFSLTTRLNRPSPPCPLPARAHHALLARPSTTAFMYTPSILCFNRAQRGYPTFPLLLPIVRMASSNRKTRASASTRHRHLLSAPSLFSSFIPFRSSTPNPLSLIMVNGSRRLHIACLLIPTASFNPLLPHASLDLPHGALPP